MTFGGTYSRLSSKTIWGAITAAAGFLVHNQAAIVSVVPHQLGVWITAIGSVVAVVGVRDAIAKNGEQK